MVAYESPGEFTGGASAVTLTRGGVTIQISTIAFDERYNNKIIYVVTPQPTGKQSSGPKDPLIINLLRVERKYEVKGYIASADRANLRAMMVAGGDKAVPTYLNWDGLSKSGVIESLTLTRTGLEEQDEWNVTLTFTEGVAQ